MLSVQCASDAKGMDGRESPNPEPHKIPSASRLLSAPLLRV